MDKEAYSVKDSANKLGVSRLTIKNWIYKHKIKSFKTPTGHHRILIAEINKIKQPITNKAVIYSRVSSYQQKDDLERQKQRLREYATQNNYEIILDVFDISSGLNDKRKRLYQALEFIKNRNATTIIIEHRDRLTRFGFNYLNYMVESYGGVIKIVEEKEEIKDLTRDLVDVITCFCARMYGRRSNKARIKQKLEELK